MESDPRLDDLMRVFREIEIAAREFILEGGKRAGSMKRAEANAAVAEMSAFASLAFPSSDSVLPSAELRQRAWEVGVRGWLRAADDALAHPQAWGPDERARLVRLGERTAEALRSGWFLRDSQRAFSTVQRRQAWDQAVADRGGRLPLCERCGAEVSWRDYSVDHRTPWTAGGPTTLGNAALMHATCYSSKGRSVAT